MARKKRSKCGEKLCFHGSYGKRSKAEAKLRTLSKKARILFRAVGGAVPGFRYVVVSPKKS